MTKKWKTELGPNIVTLSNNLFALDEFTSKNIETSFHDYLDSSNMGFGKIMPMLRIAITGNLAGPSMFHSLKLIGREKMKRRVESAIDKLK